MAFSPAARFRLADPLTGRALSPAPFPACRAHFAATCCAGKCMLSRLPPPHVVIILEASPETCLKRSAGSRRTIAELQVRRPHNPPLSALALLPSPHYCAVDSDSHDGPLAAGHGELAPPTAGFSRQQRVPRALARVGDLRLAEPSPRHDPMRPSGDEALLRAGPAIRERRGRRSCGESPRRAPLAPAGGLGPGCRAQVIMLVAWAVATGRSIVEECRACFSAHMRPMRGVPVTRRCRPPTSPLTCCPAVLTRPAGDPSLADRRARPCASDRRLLRRRHPGHGFEAAARPAGVAVAPLSHQRLQPALSASAGSRDRPAGYFCRKRWRKEQRGWTSLCRCSEQARPAPGAPCQNGWRSKKATWSDGVSERRRQAIE